MSRDDQLERKLFRMVNAHSDAVKAAELDMTVQDYRRMMRRAEWERRRRLEVCQGAAAVLFFGSGLCASFGAWCFWYGAGPLAVLGALASAAVAAAVGFWCDGWSRE